eukprot:Seg2030.12 transcript_id=Seg2030.12/GoldUCD/mRNA.D3Y31 product="Golgi to ER traffic protein 4-like" protein_id=Seg2030.12/GoldUCD/D3Y31
MASGRQRNERSRNERIYQKFARNVEDGNFYEASQVVKTLYFRYKVQEKYDEAIKLLYDCSKLLLQHEQLESGIDLARQMIKCYEDGKKEVTEEKTEKITDIVNLCNKDSASRHDLVREALRWSKSGHKFGHPKIHETIATKYWEEGEYKAARQHFVHSSEGKQYATFLVEYHVTSGYPGEIDMFVTQAVLQVLCLQKTPVASLLFCTYVEKHPGIKRRDRPYKQPLLNFIAFLLLAVEIGSLQQFTTLCEQYQPSISRDPIYFEYLDKIGQLFFGLPPKEEKRPEGLMGMIGDIVQSMMGDSSMEVEAAAEEDID